VIVRECASKHPIAIYRSPYGVKEVASIRGTPTGRFCTAKGGQVLYDGDSYPLAEQAMIDACAQTHTQEQKHHGRWDLAKHKMVGGRLKDKTELEEDKLSLPTIENLKWELVAFCDAYGITYNAGDTKQDLVDKIHRFYGLPM